MRFKTVICATTAVLACSVAAQGSTLSSISHDISGGLANQATHNFSGVVTPPLGTPGSSVQRRSVLEVLDFEGDFDLETGSTGFSFPLFDPELGTLQRVEMRYRAISTGQNGLLLRSTSCSAALGSCEVDGFENGLIQLYGLSFVATPLSEQDSRFARTFDEIPDFFEEVFDPSARIDVGGFRLAGVNFANQFTTFGGKLADDLVTFEDPDDLEGFTFRRDPTFDVGNRFTVQPFVQSVSFGRVVCDPDGLFAFVTACDAQTRAFYDYAWTGSLTYIYEASTPPPPPAAVIPLPASLPVLLTALGLLGFIRCRSS